MAFQQPQRPQAARNLSYSTPTPPRLVTSHEVEHPSPQQSREWVLFSPAAASLTEERTVSTARTPRTAGRSHLSELGSLDTAAVSERYDDEDIQEEDLETDDVDSLDDGLHAFHEPLIHTTSRQTLGHSAETVLPTHDGLGTFPGNSSSVQEQIWQHERHNPRRKHQSQKRTDVLHTTDVRDGEQQPACEDERFQRIEKWRLDQSRAILEEIERETKRKRRRSKLVDLDNSHRQQQIPETPVVEPITNQDSAPSPVTPETESFWARFTRKVIQDLMGFDDATLSIIFGEQLVEDRPQVSSAAEIIDHAQRSIPEDAQLVRVSGSWEDKLLVRIAKELGILVNQLSEHPGAFSTYLRAQDAPSYAGLSATKPVASEQAQPSTTSSSHKKSTTTSEPHFTPTLANHQTRHQSYTTDASLWGIEEETPDAMEQRASESAQLQNEREYWECDLDVKMVFGYLRDKLSSSPPPTSTYAPAQEPRPDYRSTATSLRRAALIRQHHPLVSRNHAAAASARALQNLERSRTAPSSPPLLRRRHSGMEGSVTSCASQSTKRSKTGRSGSSRNYWDVGARTGGSLGSGGWGSAGWGEV